jgi:outer membrane PBP1 activator LpoA protein
MNRFQLPTIVLLAALLAACAPSGPGTRPDTAADAALGQAEALVGDGEFREAALAFQQLAATRPLDSGRWHLRAAEAWMSAGELDSAEDLLSGIETETLDDRELVRLDLARAELTMRRGDLANAGWLLASTADRLPPELVSRHAELEALLLELESEPVRDAFAALQDAMGTPGFSGETALALMLEFPLDDLERVLFQAADQPELLPWLDLVITAREHLLDDESLAPALSSWERRWPNLEYPADEALAWIAAWRQTRPTPRHITVLLPGSDSPLQRPGEALREGLIAGWLALPPRLRPELAFRYVGQAPEAVLSAWFDAREAGTDFIIGPIDRAQADLLAEQPDAGLVPTLLLNLPDEPEALGRAGGEIAALALPPETEAELAAIHALAAGHRRALVLSQYSDWGERVAETFMDTFRLGGGEIVADRIYDPELPDHSTLLSEMLGVDESERRIARLSGVVGGDVESVAQRRTDIDVIFLGARVSDGRLIRPQLEFFDAGDVTLMATSYIVDGAPRPGRDRDLDGVTTPMPPWFLDFTRAGAIRQRSRDRFPGLDVAALSRLHALGRDAIALLPWLSMMREDPQLSLPGMVGELSLPGGQVVRRDLPVVRIDEGLARPAGIDDGSSRAR